MKSVEGIYKRLLMLVLALAIWGAIYPGRVWGQDSSNVTMTGRIYDLWASAGSVCIWEATAYVSASETGLKIIDFSDPADPVEIGNIPTDGHAGEVEAVGGYLYLLDSMGESNLRIFDLTDPHDPVEIGQFYRNEGGQCMTVDENGIFAHISYWDGSMKKINITDPANPYSMGTVNDADFDEMEVSGGYLYGSDYRSLVVFYAAGPVSPVNAATLELSDIIDDLAIANNRAYLAVRDTGLVIVDISVPASPAIIGTYVSEYEIHAVDAVGDLAYVSDYYELSVIDCADPANPVLAGYLETGPYASEIDAAGGTAYAVCRSGGFRIYDVADPGSISESGVIEHGVMSALQMSGDYLFAFNSRKGMTVIDVSVPEAPVEIAEMSGLTGVNTAAVSGDYLCIAGEDSTFRIIGVANPAAPEVIYSHTIEGYCYSISAEGSYAFLISFEAGGSRLTVFNFADPENVIIEFDDVTGDWAYDLSYKDGILFILGANGLEVYDFGQWELNSLTRLPTCMCTNHVYVYGDTLLLGSSHGVDFYDISVPESPVYLDNIECVQGNTGLSLDGDHLFAAHAWESGINVADITDISNSSLTGYYYHNNGYSKGICVRGDYCYYLNSLGIEIYDCSVALPVEHLPDGNQAVSFSLSPIYPNPFNAATTVSFNLSSSGNVSLKVFDITGREVQSLVNGHLSLGKHEAVWDAEGCASGVYLVRLTVDEKAPAAESRHHSSARKVVLVK